TARGAPETAVAFLRRALTEPPADPALDAAIRLDLALALTADRQPGTAEMAHDVVARIHDPAAPADAALRCGRPLGPTGDRGAGVALHRLVLDAPDGVPPETLARSQAELAAAAWTERATLPLVHDVLREPRTELPLWRVVAAMASASAGGTAAECRDLL